VPSENHKANDSACGKEVTTYQEDEQGQPSYYFQLVNMLSLGYQKAAGRKAHSRKEGGPGRKLKLLLSQKPSGKPSHEEVQGYGKFNRLRWGKPNQEQPVDPVEEGELDVGQKRTAHEKVRIPKRDSPFLYSLCRQMPVGVKIGEKVQPSQDAVSEEKLVSQSSDC